MQLIDTLKKRLPDYAKDVRLNLDAVIGRSSLTPAAAAGNEYGSIRMMNIRPTKTTAIAFTHLYFRPPRRVPRSPPPSPPNRRRSWRRSAPTARSTRNIRRPR